MSSIPTYRLPPQVRSPLNRSWMYAVVLQPGHGQGYLSGLLQAANILAPLMR